MPPVTGGYAPLDTRGEGPDVEEAGAGTGAPNQYSEASMTVRIRVVFAGFDGSSEPPSSSRL